MKRIITLVLSVLMAVSCFTFIAPVSAASSDGVLFSFNYAEKMNGVVDGKQTAKVHKNVKVDGENTVKIVPSFETALVTHIQLDCYSISYSGKDLEGAKYVTVKYRYDGDASLTQPMLLSLLPSGGALTKSIAAFATEPTKSGEWAVAVFDISDIEGNISFDDGKVFKQFHFFPYGDWSVNVNNIKANNVMYISDVTFWNKEPDLSKIKLPEIVDKFDYKEELAAQEEALRVLPPLEGDENGLLFSFNYYEKNNSIVDGKQTATVNKNATEDGIRCLKVVPTPETAMADFINLDCYSIKYRQSEIVNARYVAIKYKYFTPDGVNDPERMTLTLLTGGGALKNAITVDSINTIKRGVWSTAIFNISGKALADKQSGYFQQFHLYPYGSSMNVSDLSPMQEMYIAEISFYTKNPDPDLLFDISFTKGNNPDTIGAGNESVSMKVGEVLTLPEPNYECGDAQFSGWRCSSDGKLYPVGSLYVVPDDLSVFSAEFDTTTRLGGHKVLDFIDYSNGSVDGRDNITVNKQANLQNRKVVKITFNPNGKKADTNIMLDGYSYEKASVDLSEYKYLVITYYLDGDFPEDTVMIANMLPNGGALTKGVGVESTAPLTTGKWDFALFDFSEGIDAALNPDSPNHILKQMHIIPVGWQVISKNLTGNEALYIHQLMFYKEKPDFVAHEAYMKGYDGGLFKPQGNMTRAEATTIVARLSAGSDELVPTDNKSSFSDVKSTDWYHKYISYVESLGYLGSYKGTFSPNKPITRAEFVELVYNMGLLSDKGANGVFTDVPASHPKASVIAAAGKAGLVNGYDNGNGTFSFKPDNTITRAEVVKVVNNAYGRSITADKLSEEAKYSFGDVEKNFWAYPDIMEATLPHIDSENGWQFCQIEPISMFAKTEADIDFTAGEKYLAELDKMSAEKIEAVRNTPNMDPSKITGTKYYVSNNGNDNNDGKSPETAWKTIAKVQKEQTSMIPGDAILFERGGLWRERITKSRSGVIYSAYGEGPKPKIYGSPENGADPSKWTLMPGTNNIWVYATELLDVGGIIIDEGKLVGFKEIPDLVNGKFYVRNSGRSKEFDIKTELNENYEFFSDVPSTSVKTATGKLYFRCDEGNPGALFNQIEFNIDANVFKNDDAKDVVYDNLCIMYTGIHGISSGSTKNVTVTNCEFGWIGGAIQNYDTNGRVVRLGNGIEIYGSVDGFLVDNNYIYQCYDAGATHQHATGGTNNVSMYNITYSNNIIEDCIYNIEYFNGDGSNEKVIRDGKNLLITGNILRRAGYGWGNQRPDNNACGHIMSWASRNEYEKGTYIIENNIFDRSSYNLVTTTAEHESWAPIYKNNTYIQYIGGELANHIKQLDLAYDANAELAIKYEMGDEHAKVYFLPESYKHQGFLTRG